MSEWWLTHWHNSMTMLQWGAVLGASLVAAFTDLRRGRIPNRLTGPLFLAGLIFGVLTGGWAGLADSFCGCVVMAVPFVLLFLLGAGGAGDAKMMAALGTWLGVANGVIVLLAVVLSGLVWGLGWAFAKRKFRSTVERVFWGIAGLIGVFSPSSRGHSPALRIFLAGKQDAVAMPYGVAILSGVCIAALGVILWHA